MTDTGGIVTGLAGRYATALFELAQENKALDSVAESLAKLRAALDQSEDFRTLTTSPLIDRDQAMRAVLSAAVEMRIDPITRNFLGVLAKSRRLAALDGIIRAFNRLLAAQRGEVTAEVTSAHPLSEQQMDLLRKQLRSGLGRDVAIDLKVDAAILGGLVVQVGSKMIDSSIRTKLDTLAIAMKG